MALINCSKCGNQISDKAPSCPHCGEVFAPQSPQQNVNGSAIQPNQPANQNVQMQAAAKPMFNGKIAAIIIAVLVVIIAIAAVTIVSLSSNNQTSPNVNAPTYQNQGNAQQNQGNAPNNQGNAPVTNTYSVKISVKCIENSKANKYNVDVIVDGETIDTLSHGKSDTYTLKLKEGAHTIEFSVNGKKLFGKDIDTDNAKETFYVDKDESISYTVKCTWGDNIKIQL